MHASSQSGVFPVVFGHSYSPVWPIKESPVLMHWAVFLGIEVIRVLLLFLPCTPFRSKHPPACTRCTGFCTALFLD